LANSGPKPSKSFAPEIPREVAALLGALRLRDPSTDGLLNLSDEEWHSLLQFCELAHLTLPLAQLRLNKLPSWVEERLQKNLTDNTLRFERVKATYREAAQALDRAGVEHIVIKGFTQAPDYVADPRLRQQSDLDLLCQPKDIEQAQSALKEIGYHADPRVDVTNSDHTPAMIRLGNWQWRGNVFDPEMPLSIELHFCLWNPVVSLLELPETQPFWERRISRSLDGINFPSLDPIDHLGYMTLHILRNLFLRESVAHHLYELATFLHAHASDDSFWSRWKIQHSSGLREKQAIALFLAEAWFGCNLHSAVKEQIAEQPQAQLEWLRYFTWSALELSFHPNKDSLWLHLGVLRGAQNKLALLRRTFIPKATSDLNSWRVIVRNKRVVDTDDSHPYRRYASYLLARSLDHARMNVDVLSRGLAWATQLPPKRLMPPGLRHFQRPRLH
jgi:hypothetical protein